MNPEGQIAHEVAEQYRRMGLDTSNPLIASQIADRIANAMAIIDRVGLERAKQILGLETKP